MKLTEIDILKPESFIMLYLVFLLLAGAGFIYWGNVARPSFFGFFFALLALGAFYIGSRLSKKFPLKRNEYASLALLGLLIPYYTPIISRFFGAGIIISAIATGAIGCVFYLLFRTISQIKRIPPRFYLYLLGIGFAFLVITFRQIGGLPIINTALRANLQHSWAWAGAVFFYMFGYVGTLLEMEDKKKTIAIIIISTILFALTGFRIAILLILLSGVIAAYKSKQIGNKSVGIALISALVIVMLLGYYVAGLANPATLFLYRAATTHSVYEQVLDKSIPFGVEHGNFMLGHAYPRGHLGELLGAKNSLTSTILGPPLMEFGPLFALACMLGLGYVLGSAHKDLKDPHLKIFYPVLLAFAIVWVETGFDQYMLCIVWAYLAMKWIK